MFVLYISCQRMFLSIGPKHTLQCTVFKMRITEDNFSKCSCDTFTRPQGRMKLFLSVCEAVVCS